MASLNRLGIMVAGSTAAVVIVIYGMYIGITHLIFKPTPSKAPVQAAASPIPSADNYAIDTDNDGVPDLVENVYHTNPHKADTDGDGTNDGEEIAKGRDPLKPGPNDLVQDVATGNDLPNPNTYTAKYLATLPTNLARDQVLNKDRIQAFIEQNKGSILPELPAGMIQTSTATGKQAIQDYIDAISSTHNTAIKDVSSSDIEGAYKAYYSNPTTSSALKDIGTVLENNVAALKKVSAPQEAAAIHAKLVAASQALVDNVKLLEGTPTDFVGGLIGAKKIEDLGPIFQSISDDISTLEKKYKL
jgi:hypothetical protein